MVKHTYFSIELSILKHSVVTVVNKRRKEPNYGQKLALFQVDKQRPLKLVGKVAKLDGYKIKIITFHAHRSTPGYNQDI